MRQYARETTSEGFAIPGINIPGNQRFRNSLGRFYERFIVFGGIQRKKAGRKKGGTSSLIKHTQADLEKYELSEKIS